MSAARWLLVPAELTNNMADAIVKAAYTPGGSLSSHYAAGVAGGAAIYRETAALLRRLAAAHAPVLDAETRKRFERALWDHAVFKYDKGELGHTECACRW